MHAEIPDTVVKLTTEGGGGELVSCTSIDLLLSFRRFVIYVSLSALPHSAQVIYTGWGT